MGARRCYASWKRLASSLKEFLPENHPLRELTDAELARFLSRAHRAEAEFYPPGSYSDGEFALPLCDSVADALAQRADDPESFAARLAQITDTCERYSKEWTRFAPPRTQQSAARMRREHPDLEPSTATAAIRTKVLFSHDQDGVMVFDTDRTQIHREFVNATLKRATKVKPGQTPVAVMVIGAPASGKSSAARAEIERICREAGVSLATVNPDIYKPRLPESDGGAGMGTMIHEEAATIADVAFTQGLKRGHHLLLDAPGWDAERMKDRADVLLAHGYEVHLIDVDVAYETAVERAAVRGAVEGRYMSPELLAEYYVESGQSMPQLTYEHLVASFGDEIATGRFSASRFDNDVPFGEAPVLVHTTAAVTV